MSLYDIYDFCNSNMQQFAFTSTKRFRAQFLRMHGAFGILCLISFPTFTIQSAIYKADAKIIGGHAIHIRHRPFMLSLHHSQEFVCGATILSRRWGITALHCLVSVTTMNYYVRAGSNKPYQGGSVHRITRIYVYNETTYPYWFSTMLYHDVALFEVSPYFRFSEKVQAASLPHENSKPPEKLYVSGWGYTSSHLDAGVTNTLRGVSVWHVPFDVCVKATPEYATLVKKDYHLCYGTPGKDSCYGDSGGPLASKNTIYGIVSFGQNCGVVAGVYSKISYYRRWIKIVANL